MGKEGRRFLPNLKKLESPRLNFKMNIWAISKLNVRFVNFYFTISAYFVIIFERIL